MRADWDDPQDAELAAMAQRRHPDLSLLDAIRAEAERLRPRSLVPTRLDAMAAALEAGLAPHRRPGS